MKKDDNSLQDYVIDYILDYYGDDAKNDDIETFLQADNHSRSERPLELG